MPNFFRSLSQRFRRNAAPEQFQIKMPPSINCQLQMSKQSTSKMTTIPEIDQRKDFQCKILLLDSTNFSIVVSVIFYI